MSCIEFRNFVTFSWQIWCKISDVLFIHNLWQKCLAPRPKLSKLLRLYGPAYLHAGASIPPTTMALPHFHDSPPFRHASITPSHPTPANNWDISFHTQFCAILCAFSVNFGSWQSGIMTPKMIKYINGVGKTYCICKLRIKRNRASVASENFLRKWSEDYIKQIRAYVTFCSSPPPKKMTMAHLSPPVVRDRRLCLLYCMGH